MTSLTDLYVNVNSLDGGLPAGFSTFTLMERFDVSLNGLTGQYRGNTPRGKCHICCLPALLGQGATDQHAP